MDRHPRGLCLKLHDAEAADAPAAAPAVPKAEFGSPHLSDCRQVHAHDQSASLATRDHVPSLRLHLGHAFTPRPSHPERHAVGVSGSHGPALVEVPAANELRVIRPACGWVPFVGFPPQLGELARKICEPLRHDVDDIAFALDLDRVPSRGVAAAG